MASQRRKKIEILNQYGDRIGVRYATHAEVQAARRKKQHLKAAENDGIDLQHFTHYRQGGRQ